MGKEEEEENSTWWRRKERGGEEEFGLREGEGQHTLGRREHQNCYVE